MSDDSSSEFITVPIHRDVIADLIDPGWNHLDEGIGNVALITIPWRALDALRIALQQIDPQYAVHFARNGSGDPAGRVRDHDDDVGGPGDRRTEPAPSRVGHLVEATDDLDDATRQPLVGIDPLVDLEQL